MEKNMMHSISKLSLPPFLRVLLVSDSTVTSCLEAFFDEPVDVETLLQDKYLPDPDEYKLICSRYNHDLKSDLGDQFGSECEIIKRTACLRGRRSGTKYLIADSLINTSALPVRPASAILNGSEGIGRVLRRFRLETFRELLDVGLDVPDPGNNKNKKYHSDDMPEKIVTRQYRIISCNEPLVLVREHYPIDVFQ